MSTQPVFDLVRDLVDHELVDSDGVPCGMVDDVELSLGERDLTVTALLSGSRVWTQRLPAVFRMILPALGATRRTRIAFDQVDDISEVIRLKSRATELGLGIADRKAARLLARVVGTG
jgi:sporulation protein YlmC with PRC-barrel domain